MGKNKDLPKEEQLRIILQNYDSKKAECDALLKENSELKKQSKKKMFFTRICSTASMV